MLPDHFECKKIALSKVEDTVANACDLLICSASYEKRCLSIPLSLGSTGPKSILVLKNASVPGVGSLHAQKILQHFKNRAEVVETKKGAAVRTADVLSVAIESKIQNGATNICVDVTTMTHETLLIIFRLLNLLLKGKAHTITYLYNPAAEYDPGTAQNEKWLSKGIDYVSSVLGYSGNLLPSKRNHLIVLVGFEVNRASGLIDVFEPASMSFGYGDESSFGDEHRKVNEQKHGRLSVKYSAADHFEFSPSNAYLVRNKILEQAQTFSNKNLIVAPMNTKISTLGCALAAMANPDIQLCYASAAIYNVGNYSKPSNDCIIFQCNVASDNHLPSSPSPSSIS